MALFVPLLFFLVALIYASVGFGGGSTYTAILAETETPFTLIPIISLSCNIVVVSGSVWQFSRSKQVDLARAWPFLITSVPAAWLGGLTPVSEPLFFAILGVCLLLAGLRLLWVEPPRAISGLIKDGNWRVLPVVLGASIGYISGLVGIGGGIFLAPILYFVNWGNARQIAALCSIFILFNSCAGLSGQVLKMGVTHQTLSGIYEFLPLGLAVILGGQIGSRLGAGWLKKSIMQKMTAILILFVAVRILWRLFMY